jgi:hypothetical protein
VPQPADETGVPGNGTNGYPAAFVKYTHRKGQVVHCKVIRANHGLAADSTSYLNDAKQIVADFLLQ